MSEDERPAVGTCGRALSTGKPCPDHPVNERLERYASAMRDAYIRCAPYGCTSVQYQAVMAVADAEQRELREELDKLKQERIEWREANAMLTLAGVESQKMIVGFRIRAEKAEATIERARDALADMASWESGYDTRQVIRKALDGEQS